MSVNGYRHWNHGWAVFLSCAWICGCGESGPSGPDDEGLSTLTVVAGSGQNGFVQEILGDSVVAMLSGQDGAPIQGATVRFQPSEGAGGVSTTGADGRALFEWRLGEEYRQSLTASYTSADNSRVTAQATATARYRYRVPGGAGEWPTTSAESAGVDSVRLMELVDAIRSQSYPNVHSVLLARGGQLFLEETFPRNGETEYTGSDPELHYVASVTKSFTSTLVGIAVEEGLIGSIDEALYSFFPEYQSFDNWSEMKDSITIRDALMMRSGLACADDGEWESTTDFVKTTLDLPMNGAPGSEWRYCSILTHVLGSAVANAAGMNLADYAQLRLWGPLGITQMRWTYSPVGRAVTGYGFWMRRRDMLKFGQMILDGGEWAGQRIVSEAWIEEATTGWPTGLGGDLYGYQWWVRSFSSGGSQSIPYAAGDGGQIIFVIPEHDLTAVFTGGNYGSPLMGQPVSLLERYVLPALR